MEVYTVPEAVWFKGYGAQLHEPRKLTRRLLIRNRGEHAAVLYVSPPVCASLFVFEANSEQFPLSWDARGGGEACCVLPPYATLACTLRLNARTAATLASPNVKDIISIRLRSGSLDVPVYAQRGDENPREIEFAVLDEPVLSESGGSGDLSGSGLTHSSTADRIRLARSALQDEREFYRALIEQHHRSQSQLQMSAGSSASLGIPAQPPAPTSAPSLPPVRPPSRTSASSRGSAVSSTSSGGGGALYAPTSNRSQSATPSGNTTLAPVQRGQGHAPLPLPPAPVPVAMQARPLVSAGSSAVASLYATGASSTSLGSQHSQPDVTTATTTTMLGSTVFRRTAQPAKQPSYYMHSADSDDDEDGDDADRDRAAGGGVASNGFGTGRSSGTAGSGARLADPWTVSAGPRVVEPRVAAISAAVAPRTHAGAHVGAFDDDADADEVMIGTVTAGGDPLSATDATTVTSISATGEWHATRGADDDDLLSYSNTFGDSMQRTGGGGGTGSAVPGGGSAPPPAGVKPLGKPSLAAAVAAVAAYQQQQEETRAARSRLQQPAAPETLAALRPAAGQQQQQQQQQQHAQHARSGPSTTTQLQPVVAPAAGKPADGVACIAGVWYDARGRPLDGETGASARRSSSVPAPAPATASAQVTRAAAAPAASRPLALAPSDAARPVTGVSVRSGASDATLASSVGALGSTRASARSGASGGSQSQARPVAVAAAAQPTRGRVVVAGAAGSVVSSEPAPQPVRVAPPRRQRAQAAADGARSAPDAIDSGRDFDDEEDDFEARLVADIAAASTKGGAVAPAAPRVAPARGTARRASAPSIDGGGTAALDAPDALASPQRPQSRTAARLASAVAAATQTGRQAQQHQQHVQHAAAAGPLRAHSQPPPSARVPASAAAAPAPAPRKSSLQSQPLPMARGPVQVVATVRQPAPAARTSSGAAGDDDDDDDDELDAVRDEYARMLEQARQRAQPPGGAGAGAGMVPKAPPAVAAAVSTAGAPRNNRVRRR